MTPTYNMRSGVVNMVVLSFSLEAEGTNVEQLEREREIVVAPDPFWRRVRET